MRETDRVTRSPVPADRAGFAEDVHYYLQLQPRQLPSRYFYDELGSALFEAICRLPWYPITRTETALLRAYAPAILQRAGRPGRLVELGCGSGEKLAVFVERGLGKAAGAEVHLVDVSPSALAASATALVPFEKLRVRTHERTYETGLRLATAGGGGARTLVLYLGSNLGNFDRPGADAFLRAVRAQLSAGDALLLGTDLVKPERDLLLAYDDPLGVTAAFNLNLLARVNRELGGDFDLRTFEHRAIWNAVESRMEMHLVSGRRQRVHVAAARLEFEMSRGETIWTESSYKYDPADVVQRLEAAGFAHLAQWIDDAHPFALTLVRAE